MPDITNLVAKLVISGILSSLFLILALYTSLLTTPSLLKSTGTGTNLLTPNLSTLLFFSKSNFQQILMYQSLLNFLNLFLLNNSTFTLPP